MGEIYVRGTLDHIRLRLVRIMEIVQNREATGWRALQHDEDWVYLTERDARVCPLCRGYEHTVHRGDYIPNRFPHYQGIDITHIYPNTHVGTPFRGPCRCTLEWVDSAETIRERLHQELLIWAA